MFSRTKLKLKSSLNIYFCLRRRRHKLNLDEKKVKISTEVLNYIQNDTEFKDIKDSIPKYLLKKYKTPETMYLIHRKTAKIIAELLNSELKTNSPLIEVNPGFGFLTNELLQNLSCKMYLYDTSNSFCTYIQELQKKYPNQITYQVADFFGMWKLAYLDKIDNGNRMKELLGELATDNVDRLVNIVGAMPGFKFVSHIINTIIFHNMNNLLGRPDLFIAMPVHHYEYLTDSIYQGTKHKPLPALFQLMFDFKVIEKLPKAHYLPWIHSVGSKKLNLLEDNTLYLVNITQKEKMPCDNKHLPLLWYFFRSHMISRTIKVIPMLEQWIPGCGVWLITGQDPPDTNKEIGPTKDDAQLPHMTIFTEFGDLTLQQKLTVFKRFISWPEFEQCPFKATMESHLPKSFTNLERDEKSRYNNRYSSHIDDIELPSDIET